jgi:hypothetical protein
MNVRLYALLAPVAILTACCQRPPSALSKMQVVTEAYADLAIGPEAEKRHAREFEGLEGSVRFRREIKKIYLEGKSIDRKELNKEVRGIGDEFFDLFLAGLKLKVGPGVDDPSVPVAKSLNGDDAIKSIDLIERFYGWCTAYSPIEIKGVPGWKWAHDKGAEDLKAAKAHATGMQLSQHQDDKNH